ncbi:MAG TPA: DUF5989 family protein [Patescibacteria group bacterium]|jgi:hypothetical protein|nr:DUF5989 family protein [Patescibacteria group bacterium]
MKFIKGIFSRAGELNDLFKFLWKAKMWFIIPFIVLLIVFGLLVFFAQATGVAPFIYSLI